MAEKSVIITSCEDRRDIKDLVPAEVLEMARHDIQRAIPALAKDPSVAEMTERAIKRIPTHHRLMLGDSRCMEDIADESVHLVVTSPPYWTLKEYPSRSGQIGFG